MQIDADLVVVATGLCPHPETRRLAEMLGMTQSAVDEILANADNTTIVATLPNPLPAGDYLVVTYAGRDQLTNAALPPAVPIAELYDTLREMVGDDGVKAIETLHPLQSFSEANFTPGVLDLPGPFGFDPVALASWGTGVILGLAGLYFAYLFLFAGLDSTEKGRMFVILILFLAAAMFWSGFEQAGSSLNLFAERYTDRVLDAFDFTIPAGWFQSLNAVFIIVFAPVFASAWVWLARRHLEPSIPAKFALGLMILGSGFLVMFFAARLVADGGSAAPTWLIMTYLLHTYGELCLSPMGLALVSKLAPARVTALMMGGWFLATAIGNKLAGVLASFWEKLPLMGIFGINLVAALLAAAAIALMTPKIRRIMAEHEADAAG